MECLVDKLTKEELKEIVETSNSLTEVVIKCGYSNYQGGARRTVKSRIEKYDLMVEFNLLKERQIKNQKNNLNNFRKVTDFSEVFCEQSYVGRKELKTKILKNNLIEYKCAICGNTGEHNGKPLALQLDHINGVFNDNRLENLRFLCPNCHSQTETWGSKNISHKTEKQIEKEKLKQEKQILKDNIINERLNYFKNLNKTFGWQTRAKEDLNLSRTQIVRWLKKYYPEFLLN